MAENIITPENEGDDVKINGRKLIGAKDKTVAPVAPSLKDAGEGRYRLDTSVSEDIGFRQADRFSGLDHVDIRPGDNPDIIASNTQSGVQQGFNAIVGGAASGAVGILEGLSMIPNIITRDWEKSSITAGLSALKENINEATPIYTNPDETWAMDSSMFWNGVKGVVDSAIQFAGQGAVIAKGLGLIGKAASAIGRAAVLEEGIVGNIATKLLTKGSETSIRAATYMDGLMGSHARTVLTEYAKSVPSGFIMNQMEGTIMGFDLYERRKGELLDAGFTLKEAEKIAAEDASNLRNQNMAMMIKDVWQMKALFGAQKVGQRVVDQSRLFPSIESFKLWKADVWKKALDSGKDPLMQALGEGLEESIQSGIESNIVNQSNRRINEQEDGPVMDYDASKGSGLTAVAKYAFTPEALFEGAMGVLGGGMQTAMTQVPSKIADNRKYNKIRFEIDKLETELASAKTDEEKNLIQNKINDLTNQKLATLKGRFESQTSRIEENKAALINTFEELGKNAEDYNNAVSSGDINAIDTQKDNLFTSMVLDNLKRGTINSLRENLQSISDGTEQASNILGNTVTPEQKKNAKDMLETMNQIEDSWNRETRFVGGERVFKTKEILRILPNAISNENKRIDEHKQRLNNKINLLNEARKNIDPKHVPISDIDTLINEGIQEAFTPSSELQSQIDEVEQLKAERDTLKGAEKSKATRKINKLQKEIDSKIKDEEVSHKERTKFFNENITPLITDKELGESRERLASLISEYNKADRELDFITNPEYKLLKSAIQAKLAKHLDDLDQSDPESIQEFFNNFKSIRSRVNKANTISELGKKDLLKDITQLEAFGQGLSKLLEDQRLKIIQQEVNEKQWEEFKTHLTPKNYVSIIMANGNLVHLIIDVFENGEYKIMSSSNQRFKVTEEELKEFFLNNKIFKSEKELFNIQHKRFLRSENRRKAKERKRLQDLSERPLTPEELQEAKNIAERVFYDNLTINDLTEEEQTLFQHKSLTSAMLKEIHDTVEARKLEEEEEGRALDLIKKKEEAKVIFEKFLRGETLTAGEQDINNNPEFLSVEDREALTKEFEKKKIKEASATSLTSQISSSPPINSPAEEEVKLSDLQFSIQRAIRPAVAIAYNDRDYEVNEDNSVRNDGETRSLRPISTNEYNRDTPVELRLVANGEIHDFEIAIHFNGEAENTNSTYVPTIAGILTTVGISGSTTLSEVDLDKVNNIFSTPTGGDNDLRVILNERGLRVVELLEKRRLATDKVAATTELREYIESQLKIADGLREIDDQPPMPDPFSKVVIRHFRDEDRDVNIIVQELINLYNNRAMLKERFDKGEQAIPIKLDNINIGHPSMGSSVNSVYDLISSDPRIKLVNNNNLIFLEIPMRNDIDGTPRTTLIKIQQQNINKDLIWAIVEDYLSPNPVVTKNLNSKQIFTILQTVYGNLNDRIDFDEDFKNKERTVNIKKDGKVVQRIRRENINTHKNKFNDSIDGLVTTLITKTIGEKSNEEYSIFILNNGKLELTKMPYGEILARNLNTRLLQSTDSKGNYVYHEQATYHLAYDDLLKQEVLEQSKPQEEVQSETKEVKPAENQKLEVKEKTPETTTEATTTSVVETEITPSTQNISKTAIGDNVNLSEEEIKQKEEIEKNKETKLNTGKADAEFDSIAVESNDIDIELSEELRQKFILTLNNVDIPFDTQEQIVNYYTALTLAIMTNSENPARKVKDIIARILAGIETGSGYWIEKLKSNEDDFFYKVWALVENNLSGMGVKFPKDRPAITDIIDHSYLLLDDDLQLEDGKQMDKYDDVVYEFSDFERASFELKAKLGLIQKPIQEGLFREFYDMENTFHTIKRILADHPNMTFTDAMDLLRAKGTQFGLDLNAVVDTITKKWDNRLQNQFMTVFNLYRNSFTITLWNTEEQGYSFKIIDGNRNSGGNMLHAKWRTNFMMNGRFTTVVDGVKYFKYNELKKVYDKYKTLASKMELLPYLQKYTHTDNAKIRSIIKNLGFKSVANPPKALTRAEIDYIKTIIPYTKSKNSESETIDMTEIGSRVASILNEINIEATPEHIVFILQNPEEFAYMSNGWHGRKGNEKFSKGEWNEKTGGIGTIFSQLLPQSTMVKDGLVDSNRFNPFDKGGNYITNLGKLVSGMEGNQYSESFIASNGNMTYNYALHDHLTRRLSEIKEKGRDKIESNVFGKDNDWFSDENLNVEIIDSIKKEGSDEFIELSDASEYERELDIISGIQSNGNKKRRVHSPTNSDKSRSVKFVVSEIDNFVESLEENSLNFATKIARNIHAETRRMEVKYNPDQKNDQFDNGYRFYYTIPDANYAVARKNLMKQLKDLPLETIEEAKVRAEQILATTDLRDALRKGLIKIDSLEYLTSITKDDSYTTVEEFVDSILAENYNKNSNRDDVKMLSTHNYFDLYISNKFLTNAVNKRKAKWEKMNIISRGSGNNVTSTMFDAAWLSKMATNRVAQRFVKGKTEKEDRWVTDLNKILNIAAIEYELYSILNNANYYRAISGDPAQHWKGVSKAYKRKNPDAVTSGNIAEWDASAVLNSVKQTAIETVKRNAKNLATGVIPNYNVWKEDIDGKPIYEQQETYDVAVIEDDTRGTTLESFKSHPVFSKQYEKVERTDAVEWVSAEEQINFLFALGKLQDAQYLQLIRKARIQDKLKWNEDVPVAALFTDEELSIVFGTPTKPVQVGELKLGTGDAYNSIYFYGKTAAFPIVHQTYKNHDIAKIKDLMNNTELLGKKVSRVIAKSGVKSGAINVANIWNNDGTVNENSKLSPITLPRTAITMQQDQPYSETKHEILVLSQMNKLITEGTKHIDPTWNEKKENIRKEMFALAKKEFISRFKAIEQADGTWDFEDHQKVIDIFRKEAERRGFGPNELASIKLHNGKLILPLFFNGLANKWESLATSIITNIVRQHTHGHSYVQMPTKAVSTLSELTDAEKSGIIYIENHDSSQELKYMDKTINDEGDEVVKPVEVIIPWKFANENGTISNIEDFMKDGKLDMNKVPEELLRLIGARIPNQGHNSMSPIKIVGFLPKYMSNTIIVPAEIANQMGSDYDVDKLYTYMWNYKIVGKGNKKRIVRYNSDNIVKSRVYKQVDKEFEERFKELKERRAQAFEEYKKSNPQVEILFDLYNMLYSSKEELRNLNEELNQAKAAGEDTTELGKKINELNVEIKDTREQIEIQKRDYLGDTEIHRKSDFFSDEFDALIEEKNRTFATQLNQAISNKEKHKEELQNEYYDLHWEILTHPEMFDRIRTILDIEDLANEYDRMQQSEDENTSLISSEFNEKSYIENRSGKEGVAIMANLVVINSMMQNLKLPEGENLKLLQHGEPVSIKTTIANEELSLDTFGIDSKSIYSNKELGINVERRIHDNLQNIQSEAVDNAKYGRLGSLNFNKNTFGAIGALLMLSGKNKKGEYRSVANDVTVALFTQPAILDFLTDSAVIFNQFNQRYSRWSNSELRSTHLSKYSENINKENIVIPSKEELEFAKNLNYDTATVLERAKYKEIQYNALNAYFALSDIGRIISDTQAALDASTKGIGKSFIESRIKERLYNERIINDGDPSFDYDMSISNTEFFSDSEYGAAVEEGVVFGNRIFEKFFPYNHLFDTISDLAKETGIELSEENYRYMFDSFRAYSLANNKLYTTTVEDERNRLLHGPDNIFDRFRKFSLSEGEGQYLLKNTIIEEKNVKDQIITTLRFAAAKSDRADGFKNTTALIQMLRSLDPERRRFAKDLITYALLVNPIQGANNFIKYIPTSVLQNNAISSHLRNINDELLFKMSDLKPFIKQLHQSNDDFTPIVRMYGAPMKELTLPSKAELISQVLKLTKILENDPINSEASSQLKQLKKYTRLYKQSKNSSIFPDFQANDIPKYITINYTWTVGFGPDSYRKVEKVKYEVTKLRDGGFIMEVIPKTSMFDFREFNSSEEITKSFVPTNNQSFSIKKDVAGIFTNLDSYGITDKFNPKNDKIALKQIISNGNSALQTSAKILYELPSIVEGIIIDNKLKTPGSYNTNDKIVRINPNLRGSLNSGTKLQDLNYTIIHELWHSHTEQLFDFYINDKSKLTNKQIEIIAKINNLRKLVIDQVSGAEFNTFLGVMVNYYENKKKNNPALENSLNRKIKHLRELGAELSSRSVITSSEKSKFYGLISLDEFVSMAWSDQDFQKILANVKFTQKTFFDKLVDLFNELLKTLAETIGIEVGKDTVLAHTLVESVNLAMSEKYTEDKNEIIEEIKSNTSTGQTQTFSKQSVIEFGDTESFIDNEFKENKEFAKREKVKVAMSNQFIGGETERAKAYANTFGNKANTGVYNKNDVVQVYVEENAIKNGELQGVYTNIDEAIAAKAQIILDGYAINDEENEQAMDIIDYLAENNYIQNYDMKNDTLSWRPREADDTIHESVLSTNSWEDIDNLPNQIC